VHLVHGSPLGLNDFFWESLPDEEVRLRVAASGAGVILCTHSGLPWQRRVDGTLVVNVGVIGRPANDGRREVWYAVLDLVAGRAEAKLVPLAYDWAAQAASMRSAGLPEAFTETIETGWWTTCLQVLPPAERARGRFHLYRADLAPGAGGDGLEPVADDNPARPVVPVFGSARFPRRLWVHPSRAGALEPAAIAAGFIDVRVTDRPAPGPGELVAADGWFAGHDRIAGPDTSPGTVKTAVIERLLRALPPAVACAPAEP
ncbi:MAG: metallophosphoesterase family protein, partial [Acidimicrobiales bacterium]